MLSPYNREYTTLMYRIMPSCIRCAILGIFLTDHFMFNCVKIEECQKV